MKRALRRHHKDRMKQHARFVAAVVWRYGAGDTRRDDVVEAMVTQADHLKACSCQMCRNPRRCSWRVAQGKTRKELLVEKDLNEQRQDY